jgi:hypothetical protein
MEARGDGREGVQGVAARYALDPLMALSQLVWSVLGRHGRNYKFLREECDECHPLDHLT